MGLGDFFQTWFVKKPNYSAPVEVDADFETVYAAVQKLYGALGMVGKPSKNEYDPNGSAILEYYCSERSEKYYIARINDKKTHVKITVNYHNGNAVAFHKAIVRELQKKVAALKK